MSKFLILICLCFLPACNFGDTNLDPTRPTDAELKEILPTAIAQTAHNLTSIGGRVTGIVVQHFKGIDAQPEGYNQYLIDEQTLNSFWRTGLFGGAMKNCHLIIEKATTNQSPHYEGIAKILMAINLGIATTFWGEVPFEEAFLALENVQPSYDSQEVLYTAIQQLLEEAILNLQELPSENPPTADDLIFAGQAENWIATAKALQVRYLLHTSKRNEQAVQNALNILQSGAFQTLEKQPIFPFGDNLNEANPLPLYCFERSEQLVMSDYLFQLLESTNDPRIHSLTKVINGIPVIYIENSLQLYWGQFDAPLPLISLTELQFIEAEILLRLGENAAAEMVFKNAVKTHFEQINLSILEHASFFTNHIHFDDCPSFEQQLERLIQQKHLALFAQNPVEAWVDFRRTGFPNLSPPSGANPSFNHSLVIPKRYLYPISERTTNEVNLNEAIQRQGGHLLDVGIWLFE